jgi:DnaJ-class molecular chaperone
MGWILIVGVIFAVGYYLSLRFHPFTKCRLCNGTGRHFGAIYTYAQRRCRRCGGTGRKYRYGLRFFGDH